MEAVLGPTIFRQICERRIRRFVTPAQLKTHGLTAHALTQRVSQIVANNLESGRVRRVLHTSSTPDRRQLTSYVDRVITVFLLEHGRVERLVNCDVSEWTQLTERLAARASTMLLRLRRSSAEALDFAQEASEAIFSHPFPFDVDFDAWTTLILKNCILQRYTRSRDLLDRAADVLSLDQPSSNDSHGDYSLYDLLADPSSAIFEQRDVQEWLIQAIEQLSGPAQQQVIIGLYFDDRREDDIARYLGRSPQAVYNLKHRALQRLRQLLVDERNGDASALVKESDTFARE